MRGTGVLVVSLLWAGTVGAEELVFDANRRPGQRLRVETRAESELTQRLAGRDAAGHKGSAGAVEVSVTEAVFVEEVLAAKPLRVGRTYELSTRAKHRGGDDPAPERTSLHGRTIRVEGLELTAVEPGAQIAQADREALRFDRLAAAMLPPAGVAARGDAWRVGEEAIGRALWGAAVPVSNLDGSGAKVKLKRVNTRDGRRVAELRVSALRVALTRTEAAPGLTLDLEGELSWDLDEGVLLAGRLEGQLEFSLLHRGDDGGQLEATAAGSVRWRWAAAVIESRGDADSTSQAGDPPPPGTLRLVCERDALHRVELGQWRHCVRCGAALRPGAGCEEHGWLLQRCPHDGSPFRPE